jgi:DNA-binding transcriptional ArsR family regulator
MSISSGVVFGAPRSGTTFLMRALEALPDVECVSGNLLPVGVVHVCAQELAPNIREALERSFAGSFQDYLESSAYRSRSAALRKWSISSRAPGALRAALKARRSESMLVYKEPFLAFVPDFAYRALPDARLIYLYRDGRDVADSLVRTYDVLSDEKLRRLSTNEVILGRRLGERFVPWWVAEGEDAEFLDAGQYVRAIWMWRELVRRSRRFLEREDVRASGRVLAMRYEQMMSDPLTSGQAVAAHLGQPLSPPMRRRLGGAHTNSLGIHGRREVAEIAAAELVAGAELQALGYALTQ